MKKKKEKETKKTGVGSGDCLETAKAFFRPLIPPPFMDQMAGSKHLYSEALRLSLYASFFLSFCEN